MTGLGAAWAWASVIALALAPLTAAAADLGAVGELCGDFSTLVWRTRDTSSEVITSAQGRLRLELEGSRPFSRGDLSWRVAYDNEIIAGGLVQAPEFAALRAAVEPTYADGVAEVTGGGSYLWRHRIYRAYGAWETADWRVIVGRQRVAWGSGRIWNPTDRFNPTSATALVAGQKTGLDSVFAERYFGSFGALQVVAAPGKSKRGTSRKIAVRWRDTVAETDYAVMAGRMADEPIAGLDLNMNVFGGGMHFEATAGWPRTADRYGQFSVGYNVVWQPEFVENPLSLGVEYFRNGAATGTSTVGLPPDRINSRRRDLWAGTLGYDLSFLWRAQITVLVDTQTGSRAVLPSVGWSAGQDVDVTFSAQFYAGGAKSEYGVGQDTLVVRVVAYF